MGRLFGTDGVRGLAGADLTAELALGIAAASVRVLAARRPAGAPRPHVIVGRDTRPSGEFLEAAVVAGLASAGADVLRLGVVPTPAVAFAVADSGADLGVVLSASHNPMPDNGIKLFGPGGRKLPDDVEDAIEADLTAGPPAARPTGADVGRVTDDLALVDRYADHLLATLTAPLDGLRVVVDCAEGAASALAPAVLRKAGADVVALHAAGRGELINDRCGATHMDALRTAVLDHGADVGIAHDGDADRCLAVDATGAFVDGDQIIALLAIAMRDRGALRGDLVVSTVMANLGFRHAMRDAGITVLETPVGDRYVLEAMVAADAALGGEQSGHVIFADLATTGDGLLTALQVLGRVAETRRSLADLAGAMCRLPQVLINVRVADKDRAATSADLAAAVRQAEVELGDTGRVLLRPSGTEPLVRVMVEAPTAEIAGDVAKRLAVDVERALA